MTAAGPTLDAIVRAAMDATGADRGWLLRIDGDELEVVAAAAAPGVPGAPPAEVVGDRRPRRGVAAYVAGSGQAAVVRPRPDDADNMGAAGLPGVSASVLAAPCLDDDVVGVIELACATSTFGFDDVETVGWLAEIAGAALTQDAATDAPPTPAQLGAALTVLSTADPRRYAEVARTVARIVAGLV